MKKKPLLLITAFFFISFSLFAQEEKKSAFSIKNEALKEKDLSSSINYLLSNEKNTSTASDRRALLYFTAGLLEQSQRYEEASALYAKAAGISAGNAEKMSEVTNEEIVLCAVRCCLAYGNFETAESYLNSAVRSSKDKNIKAYVNLYSAWTALCRAKDYAEASDTVELLKAYSSMSSMKSLRPSVLFTLWYVSGKNEYAESLVKDFPSSPEALIVKGKINLEPAPFWLYMVRDVKENEKEVLGKTSSLKTQETSKKESEKIQDKNKALAKRQLGLFREKKNALNLISDLKEKGFNAYIIEEKRASGTTYYIVIVDENAESTMGLKLKDAGFESYIYQ